MTAPGHTAYEDEMREALATELALVVYEGGMVTPRAFADRLLAGPLARLQADLTAAREERDRAQAVADRLSEADAGQWLADIERYRRLHAAEVNLIALAKMYGAACGELANHRAAAEQWHAENLDYSEQIYRWQKRAEAAESEASQLRERVGKLEAELATRPPPYSPIFTCPKCGTQRGWFPACMQDGCPLLGLEGEEIRHAE